MCNFQTEEYHHLHIKIFTALFFYNGCTLLNMMEICVANNNKCKIHPRGMATLKKHTHYKGSKILTLVSLISLSAKPLHMNDVTQM